MVRKALWEIWRSWVQPSRSPTTFPAKAIIGYPSESVWSSKCHYCLVRKSLSGSAHLYLADDCCLVSDSTRHSLRSADVPTCIVPRTLSSYGDTTFAAAGPRLWNSLPVQLRNPDITYRLFRRQPKGHLHIKTAFCETVTSDMRRLRKTLTCLLT